MPPPELATSRKARRSRVTGAKPSCSLRARRPVRIAVWNSRDSIALSAPAATVEESAERGLPAPFNKVVVDITRRIEAGELQPDPSNLALARQMLAG